ncbi:MAG TPA: sigma-70 family RNA polymerase sigma factor [Steroidobacteraceae bacterium]|nr:sigma-70 family RNA polymerase sigma factor [Steroidobacteraceae bacterium]
MTAPTDDRDALAGLLTRTGKRDQRAFAELYRHTGGRLFGVCLRMLRDPGDAEEVLQEVFTTVWRRADGFDPARASALTWLVALTRNKAIDRLRQRREVPLDDPIDLDRMIDERPAPPDDAEASQDYVRLLKCLEALEPKQRRSVRAAFFTGATYNELAARCQVPLGTFKSWIRRGLIQLRECLES